MIGEPAIVSANLESSTLVKVMVKGFRLKACFTTLKLSPFCAVYSQAVFNLNM